MIKWVIECHFKTTLHYSARIPDVKMSKNLIWVTSLYYNVCFHKVYQECLYSLPWPFVKMIKLSLRFSIKSSLFHGLDDKLLSNTLSASDLHLPLLHCLWVALQLPYCLHIMHFQSVLHMHVHLLLSLWAALQLPYGLDMMLLGVHFHTVLPVHFHLLPCLWAALQWPYGLHLMLPGVHFHSLLPVHVHVLPCLWEAWQWPHSLYKAVYRYCPNSHKYTLLSSFPAIFTLM